MQFKMKPYIFFQHFVPQHALSRFAGWMANCRWHWLKTFLIKDFIRRYKVDLSLAVGEKVDDYPNFNSFFTRQLKSQYRPITQDQTQIACPVDGCVSQVGKIQQQTLFQAKGHQFNLNDLVGNEKLAQAFYDGSFATLYLAPKDYHRVHMPLTGKLTETIYIPGKLFSVNKLTAESVPQLFSRNERLVCLFSTEVGPIAVILVGAMIVGKIGTVWEPDYSAKTFQQKNFADGVTLEKGAELGHFELGSTVILLFPKNTMEWNTDLKAESIVTMGSAMGRKI